MHKILSTLTEDISAYASLLRHLSVFHRRLVWIGALALSVALMEAGTLGTLPSLISFLQTPSQLPYLAWFGGFFFFRIALQIFYRMVSNILKTRILSHLRESVLKRYYQIPYRSFLEAGPGKLLHLFCTEIQGCAASVEILISLFTAIVLCLTQAGLLWYLSWQMTVFGVLLAFVLLAVCATANSRIYRNSAIVLRKEEELHGLIFDDISGMAIIRANGIQNERLLRHRETDSVLSRHLIRSEWWEQGFQPATQWALTFFFCSVVLVSMALTNEGLFGRLPSVFSFFVILVRFQSRTSEIGRLTATLAEHRGEVKNFLSLFSRESKSSVALDSSASGSPSINLRNVSFSYSPDKMVLKDIDFQFASGKLIGVIGKSGSGKSTLVQILAGLLTPEAGEARINGSKLAIVFQEGHLFDDTISWNISLGRELSPSAIQEAATAAGLSDFINSLPKGYETRVGAGNDRLSAGQRQRVEIARALAGDPDILILDEATSALDHGTEQAILGHLRGLAESKLVILITHRTGSLTRRDQVVALEDGVIKERAVPLPIEPVLEDILQRPASLLPS
jgi:ABC-type multidrug transport system fused ATPase/permease subunit